MLKAVDAVTGKEITASNYAYHHRDDSGEYLCPGCGRPVEHVIRTKLKWNSYFRHKRSSEKCIFTTYENSSNCKSKWHTSWQQRFKEEECEVVFKDEETGKRYIADVFFDNTVVEFQHSPISEEEFTERTLFHTTHGRHVIWLFDVKRAGSKSPYIEKNHAFGYVTDWRWREPFQTFCSYDVLVAKSQDRVFLFFQQGEADSIHDVVAFDNGFSDFSTAGMLTIDGFLKAVRDIIPYRQAVIEKKERLEAEEANEKAAEEAHDLDD